jgi:hypothetical protein
VGIDGTATVVRFNWPAYVAAAGLAAVAVGGRRRVPRPVGAALGAAAGAGAFWSAASVAATWWVYDHRRVYERIAPDLGAIGPWAGLHAGFDDATVPLTTTIGHPPEAVVALDVPSTPRLERLVGRGAGVATVGTVGELPLDTGSLDAVFTTFSVHEVRDVPGQRALFDEVRRVLRPGGRFVVTEHLRGPATALVYGPGTFHFQTRRTWTARAAEAGFTLDDDATITPFVHRLVLRR